MKNEKYKIATLDAETDPFKYGRKPLPFAWGFLYNDGDEYIEFWGDDCTAQLIEFLKTVTDKQIIYAHNGGKFDFHYLLTAGVLHGEMKIINGRIVSANIGIHELRDSYAILPVPLAAYCKEKIDYNLFERETREENKADILHYLATDCQYLYELVSAFIEKFGLQLTIGGTAIKTLKKMHPFKSQNKEHDEKFRQYYFGGRVECFKTGVIAGNFKVYDVNSMYPHVMAHCDHPTGKDYIVLYANDLDDNFYKTGVITKHAAYPYFITFAGESRGALCVRTKAGLNFNAQHGEFETTSHELQTALKHGAVTIDKVLKIYLPRETINFSDFVNTYQIEKQRAKKDGDKTSELFSKLLQNSSYGKFGQNPANFYDYMLRYGGEKIPDMKKWELFLDSSAVEIWRKPSPKPVYYDVATAASITGAARAVLFDALMNAKNAVYCDTDSIICEQLNDVHLDPLKLGAWDCEATGDTIALAGKKLYALFDNGECNKMASKGARLTAAEIVTVAGGKEIKWFNDAPNFKLTGGCDFISRKINRNV